MLWFARNKVVHECVIPNISSLASSIRRTYLDHAAAWKSPSPLVKVFWSPPAVGTYKINFDTAIRETFSVQAVVCRDSNGLIVKALSQINPPCDPNFGEALAAQLATSVAASLNLSKFSLEGDSAVVIEALNNPLISQDWHIDSVISATLSLLPASSCWEANFCAHYVAFWAAARVFSDCIPTYFPPSFFPHL
jgi:hypothetical protein